MKDLRLINEVAKKAHIDEQYLEYYGRYKAKINDDIYETLKDKKDGKLVLVTAITPTKAGEGKTTSSIALLDGMAKIGQDALLCLREPSLGPVFGIKGGATGGGKASIAPKEEIDLHFTGDMHALTSSINLISAIIDNHIHQGNELNIDPDNIVWKRALDMNDRALREIEVGLGEGNGVPHKGGFMITVASELMAILCISENEEDFRNRINKIIVAYTFDGKPVYLKQLKISNAIMKLMKEAFKPNIVQTLEGNPCLIHGGPFANIAHGCNSLIATKLALKLSPIVITEAGFAADLGAEKFFDIKCRVGNLKPSAVVLVATIRALKMHGGAKLEESSVENIDALQAGCANLKQHAENIAKFGVPFVIAINRFHTDTENEIAFLTKWCEDNNYEVSLLESFEKGGEGAKDLAFKVWDLAFNSKSNFKPIYDLDLSIEEKIETVCKEIYRASDVHYEEKALKQIAKYKEMGYGDLPVCMAKTPQSFTDNPAILNAPRNFTITIREVNLSAGAGFIVPITGKILTMPGLPKVPAAVKMEEEKR
ncbi:MAG: formate--tetrahydrofolate ligase [Bacilli bacterium]|jgi:formate--tetrahydrofolate ligase